MGFTIKPDKKKETVNKTIRFPKELAERMERLAQDHDVFFSHLVIQILEYYLEQLEQESVHKD